MRRPFSLCDVGYRVRHQILLREITLSIDSGQFLAIVGPNGAGKSTLLRLIAGILSPSEGTIAFEGQSLGRWKRRDLARRLSYLPQKTWTDFDLTVEDAVAMGRFSHVGGLARLGPLDQEVIRDAMVSMDIQDLAQRTLPSLSGGERQRVFLARALAQEASTLILDEPTSALDLRHQFDLLDRLAQLQEEGKTLIMAVHDLRMVWDRIPSCVVLDHGRLIDQGPSREVLPRDATQEVFGVRLDSIGERLRIRPRVSGEDSDDPSGGERS